MFYTYLINILYNLLLVIVSFYLFIYIIFVINSLNFYHFKFLYFRFFTILDFQQFYLNKTAIYVFMVQNSCLHQRNQVSLIQSSCNIIFCNTLGNILQILPLWDRFLLESLCIEVLRSQGDAETAIAVAVTVIVVSIEHTCIRSIIVIASTIGERIARIHDSSVVATQSLI